MAKKALFAKSKNSPLSQLLIAAAVFVILIAAYQTAVRDNITNIAPTQLFLIAGVLGILGLYVKDEK